MDAIREFIVDYISSHGIKQTYISEKTGIPKAAISSMLIGKRKILADEFISICSVLDIPQENINNLISRCTSNIKTQ